MKSTWIEYVSVVGNTEAGMEASLGEGGRNVGVALRNHLQVVVLELFKDKWKFTTVGAL